MVTVVSMFPGFMSTGDSDAPGNYALLDQVAALHWVKENIEAFGGNPNDVTLLGQGYGGAMVNLLLVSPVTATKGERMTISSICFQLTDGWGCGVPHGSILGP